MIKGLGLIDKKIGRRIKQIRKDWGLSQLELAERIGISFQQVQKYEKGATRISVRRLHQISKALGVKITDFFEEGGRQPGLSDATPAYVPEGIDRPSDFQPLSKEEMTLLKLFRKIENEKFREGMLKQMRGVVKWKTGSHLEIYKRHSEYRQAQGETCGQGA